MAFRKGDCVSYLVIGQHYWGHDAELATAKANFKKQGGKLTAGYTILEFPPGIEFAGVDVIGRVHWKISEGHEDTMPIETEVKPRKGGIKYPA